MGIEALLTSQIIGFAEGIDDRVSSLLIAGNGIELTYNDVAGTLTIANTGLGGSTGDTDNRILRADGTGGLTVQNSAVTIDDSGNISGLGTLGCTQISLSGNITVPTDSWFGLGASSSRFMPRTNGARIYVGSGIVAEFLSGSTSITGALTTTSTITSAGNIATTANTVTIGQRAVQDGELRLNSATGSGGIAIRGNSYGADFWTEVNGNWAAYHHARIVIGGMYLRNVDEYGWSSTSAANGTVDLRLVRDAANTLAQRNGTAAQTARTFRTYTSGAVNHHYAIVTNNGSNGYDIGTVNNGVANYITRLVNNGTTMIEFAADNSNIILRQRSISFGSANGGEVLLRQRTQFSGVLDVVDYTSQSTYNSIALNQLFVGGASSATTTRIKNTSGTMNFRLGNDSSDCNITAATATLSGLLNVGVYTVATLPAAASNAGAIAQVTDSSVTTNGSAVAGGGANRVIVFSNGSAWDVVVA